MKQIIAATAVGLCVLSTICLAAEYSAENASADAKQIWLSGCGDFKSGMNEGDFTAWLKLGDNIKRFNQIKKVAVTKLYMDGWDTARKLNGVINCGDVAPYRADDFVSGIDIRQAY